MARDFGPFPGNPMYEVVNRRMQRALAEATVSTGFAKTGQGAVTAGTGAELVIAAYPDGALVDGLYVENDTSETVTLATNTGSTNPRIDRLVLRLDMGAETIAPFQIEGTPAASPSAPTLTRTATVYDMPLCQYRFPGSASAQNPGSIVDERVLLSASSTYATGRVPVTNTALANPDAALTSVITLPAVSFASRVTVQASGRSGNAASARDVAWDFDSITPSATNVSKDDSAIRVTVGGGAFGTVSASLGMDVPANVAATFRPVYRANGNGFNHGGLVWTRGPVV